MKIKARVKMAAALAAMSIVAACAQPMEGSRSAKTAKEIERVFGDTSRAGNRAVFSSYDPDGKGFYMFRGYSELPFPDRFTQRAGENYESSLVLDVAMDFTASGSFPLYRIGLRPRKMGLQEVRTWPGFVTINAMNADGRPARLVARLPQNRSLDENGFIWSDVTYCSECFELSRMANAAERGDETAFELIDRAQAAAAGSSGGTSGFEGMVRFIGFAEEGVLSGRQATGMAPIAGAEVALSRSSLNMINPSREAYFEFADAYARESSPAKVLRATCGDYEPSEDPSVPASWEQDRMAGYVTCLAQTLADYDRGARISRIAELREQEEGLAKAGAIGDENRVRVASFEDEMRAAHALMQQTRDRFSGWAAKTASEPMKIVSAPKPAAPVLEETEGMVPPTEGSRAEAPTIGLEAEATEPAPMMPVEMAPAPTPAPAEKQATSEPDQGETVGEPLCAVSFLCPDEK